MPFVTDLHEVCERKEAENKTALQSASQGWVQQYHRRAAICEAEKVHDMTELERRTIYGNIDKRRIRELEAKVKRLEEENKALLDRVAELEGGKHECSIFR